MGCILRKIGKFVLKFSKFFPKLSKIDKIFRKQGKCFSNKCECFRGKGEHTEPSNLYHKEYIDSLMKEFLTISTLIEKLFFSSISKCVKENQSVAKLLKESVASYKNNEPITRVRECFEKFKAQCLNTSDSQTFDDNDVSELSGILNQHIKKVSDLKISLDKKLDTVDFWRVVARCAFIFSSIGFGISALVMHAHVVVAAVLPLVDKVIGLAQSEIMQVFDKLKKPYEGSRKTIVGLLVEPAIEQLNNIRGLTTHASAAIGKFNSIKARVHEQVKEFNIKLADGNDKKAKSVIDKINSEINPFQKKLRDLEREVKRCRVDLNKSVKRVELHMQKDVFANKPNEKISESGREKKRVELHMQKDGAAYAKGCEDLNKYVKRVEPHVQKDVFANKPNEKISESGKEKKRVELHMQKDGAAYAKGCEDLNKSVKRVEPHVQKDVFTNKPNEKISESCKEKKTAGTVNEEKKGNPEKKKLLEKKKPTKSTKPAGGE